MSDGNYPRTIKEMPEETRPREKMLNNGAESLGKDELIAILLGGGSKGISALSLAQSLLNEYEGIEDILRLSPRKLLQHKGVGEAKSCRIKAAFELSRRVEHSQLEKTELLDNPARVGKYLISNLSNKEKETFGIIMLNTKNRFIDRKRISEGSLDSSIVHPREVFKPAIKESAASVILYHNHPSGEPDPSAEDIQITERLVETGEIIGIDVLDHIVFVKGEYVSLKERGEI